ncbi:UDP-N-acetylglucosamine transporter yea4 [Neolecta irregularis DAH-3]|uniref:UDP-N-acetylglucosamine transporter yea4 n=1 Tax=Neolecta irregularis (strain DAH-3) TaxID=1198029 RepID=A0A1U7LVF8_NEOID|nr:UDP-N-acetylglucosamine transporter yea4 [Neolecta irregularis DAH-3]|eukprot:OLL26501.1 UDP-N-acetylglucosamine transporter yea4 [Neolecta irregularis DAH-3]
MKLKSTTIPIRRWLTIVVLFVTQSVLNNAALGFNVAIPIHIIFRSAGVAVTMILGFFISKKRYSVTQMVGVAVLTCGVLVATLSNSHSQSNNGASDDGLYFIGIGILALCLLISAVMGLLLEATYSQYGSNWREGLFYTHFLALPFFLPMFPTIYRSFNQLSTASSMPLEDIPANAPMSHTNPIMGSPFFRLLLNVLTQYVCVRGVNRLSAKASALTLAIVLNIRKFVSLGLSVLLFNNNLSPGVIFGAILVFGGAAVYARETANIQQMNRLRARSLGHN